MKKIIIVLILIEQHNDISQQKEMSENNINEVTETIKYALQNE